MAVGNLSHSSQHSFEQKKKTFLPAFTSIHADKSLVVRIQQKFAQS